MFEKEITFERNYFIKEKLMKQNKYVAFLRGINVGGNTLIKMEDLRKVFELLGFVNVRTILASGNVIFESLEKDTSIISKNIALKLQRLFGREIVVIVRTLDDLKNLNDRPPFRDLEMNQKNRLYITLVSEAAKQKKFKGIFSQKDFTILSVTDGIICSALQERPGVGPIDLMSAIEKEYGHAVTTRTWNTIIKILKAVE